MSDPSEPRQPPRPPQFTPPPDYPPTAQFPTVDPHAGYQPPPPGHGTPPPPPGYNPPPPPDYGPPPPGYEPRPPRRSNAPLIALVLAVTLLLCGGVVTASVMLARQAADKAEEIAEPILNPTLPDLLPTEAPDVPGLPTGFPDLPALPTDIPGLGEGKEISVTYEVTGDGPAEILYMEKLDGTPKRVGSAKLPWKVTTTMKGPAVVSVIAVRTGLDSGSISCKATVDGAEVAEHSAEGTLATANCYKLIID
jgi:hypothetical protein